MPGIPKILEQKLQRYRTKLRNLLFKLHNMPGDNIPAREELMEKILEIIRKGRKIGSRVLFYNTFNYVLNTPGMRDALCRELLNECKRLTSVEEKRRSTLNHDEFVILSRQAREVRTHMENLIKGGVLPCGALDNNNAKVVCASLYEMTMDDSLGHTARIILLETLVKIASTDVPKGLRNGVIRDLKSEFYSTIESARTDIGLAICDLCRRGDSDLLPLVRGAMHDRVNEIEVRAVKAVGRVGGEEAAACLLDCLGERLVQQYKQIEIWDALRETGVDAGSSGIFDRMRTIIENASMERSVARAAYRCFGKIGGERALPIITNRYKRCREQMGSLELSELWVDCTEAIGEICCVDAVQELDRIYHAANRGSVVRRVVIDSLRELAGKSSTHIAVSEQAVGALMNICCYEDNFSIYEERMQAFDGLLTLSSPVARDAYVQIFLAAGTLAKIDMLDCCNRRGSVAIIVNALVGDPRVAERAREIILDSELDVMPELIRSIVSQDDKLAAAAFAVLREISETNVARLNMSDLEGIVGEVNPTIRQEYQKFFKHVIKVLSKCEKTEARMMNGINL